MSRNIVICVDGTNNEIAAPHTNVYRIYRAASAAGELSFYQPGVGTLVNARGLYKAGKFPAWFIDSATGASLRQGFINAYTFLMQNWTPGDKIFFFGFSRGAYTVRSVAGALRVFGLLESEHQNLVPYLWQEYIDSAFRPGKRKDETVFRYGNRVRRDFSHSEDLPIEFMGVWDTVSSLGKFTEFKTLPYTRHNELIKHIRHAIAIDERRGVFEVNLFESLHTTSDVQQVWFAGYHSDVGGGQPTPESGLAMITFDWIAGEARATGLALDQTLLTELEKKCPQNALGPIHNSMDFIYSILEFLPIRKFDFQARGLRWRWPHLFRRRKIYAGDAIHLSVRERMAKDATYRPKNVPTGGKEEQPKQP